MLEENSYWEILEELPEKWIIDKTAGSPIKNTVFITNGKSVFNGQKRALLRTKPIANKIADKQQESESARIQQDEKQEIESNKEDIMFPSKTVNNLARKRFLEQMLKEIMFDLTVCEIENWDKKEYIREIKKLINSFDLSAKNGKNQTQLSLF